MSASLFDAAIALHQRHALEEAACAYRDVLVRDPRHADALHLLGVIAHQRGDSAQAVALINRAIGLSPSAAPYHANLAEAYRALGQLDRAIGCCRTALMLDPNFAEAANNLGLILMEQGKVSRAVVQFDLAVRLRPEYALAWNNLGNCSRLLGDIPLAIERFRRALALDPSLAIAHSNLGQLLLEQGELEAALERCLEAVRLQPNSPETHNNLGNALRAMDRLVEARARYGEALSLNPDLAVTHRNMGQALQEEGKRDEAIIWYRRAVQLDPQSARAHAFLAGALEDREDFAAAIVHYRAAVQLEPDDAKLRNSLGWVLHEQGHFPAALEEYRQSLGLDPEFPVARCNLAFALEELGEFDDAEREFRQVIAQQPRHALAHAQLACMLRGRLPEADRSDIVALLADPDLSDKDRIGLHFALAYVEDGVGLWSSAAEHARRANEIALSMQKRRGGQYDPDEHARFVDDLAAATTSESLSRTAGWGLESERPVFIFGLPRSGTTLTEQILASHSRAFGAGELRLARDSFHFLAGTHSTEAKHLSWLARLDRESVRAIAERHLAELAALDAAADRAIDKMPDNYLYLGVLAILFPKARFIHCCRDLRDVATSCWTTNFRHIRWANDPELIASRFAAYEKLMAHWQKVLPGRVLEVRYEETVSDLESVARRLVSWCGLEWEPGCLAFHESKRPIRTASITQVRQPLYARSVGRWKHYERELGPLFARLSTDTVSRRLDEPQDAAKA